MSSTDFIRDKLMRYARIGDWYCASFYIGRKCDYTLEDEQGRNIFVLASENQKWDFVTFFLNKFPETTQLLFSPDKNGNTALTWAKKYKNTHMIQAIEKRLGTYYNQRR